MTIFEAIDLALQHHRAGRLAEAEAIYRQVLAACPEEENSLHLLGVIAYGRGQFQDAAALISRAIAVNPGVAGYHNNLALVWTAQGRPEEAIAACRRALQLLPDSAEIHNNLGNALRAQGRLPEAIDAYHAALRCRPDFANAHNNLGVTLKESGRIEEAIAAYRAALQLDPALAEACNNLGTALKALGRKEECLAAYRMALQINPESAPAHHHLGIALKDFGQTAEAITALRAALHIRPDFAEAHNNLGLALQDNGQPEAAVAAFRMALQFKPDFPEVHTNLGLALWDESRLDAAIAAFHEALRLQPDLAAAHNNLGNALKDRGQIEEAIAAYRQAIRCRPGDAVYLSNLIFALHFREDIDAAEIRGEEAEWNRRFVAPLRHDLRPHRHEPDPGRRLRIGCVSPDFHAHAISFFIAPLLEAHDRREFEIHCYASGRRPDAITHRLAESADAWHDVRAQSDEEVAELVRDDGIDILVDLSMHTARNRLLVFARKPAPVQISWLAHAGSAGLETIGFRISDALIEPDDPLAAASMEQIVRLPDCWCCYAPLGDFPAVGPLPATQESTVTFGSLNQFAKIKEGALRRWAALLRMVPKSRLLMVCPEGQASERACGFLAAHGVAPERLELFPPGPWADYVQLFRKIDVALDSFPFNGMTTTCHALWMGVPVVTLSGTHPVSRTGLSLLHGVGLPELAAAGEAEYLRIAAELAGDLDRLRELRGGLRDRMRASPLMDAPRFARNIEAAWRNLWRHWCEEQRG